MSAGTKTLGFLTSRLIFPKTFFSWNDYPQLLKVGRLQHIPLLAYDRLILVQTAPMPKD